MPAAASQTWPGAETTQLGLLASDFKPKQSAATAGHSLLELLHCHHHLFFVIVGKAAPARAREGIRASDREQKASGTHSSTTAPLVAKREAGGSDLGP